MNFLSSPRFLPAVLWADAASALATGALQLAAAPLLSEWLGLSAGLLTASGWVLLAVGAYAAWIARGPIRRPAVLALVAGNALWVAGCVELLLTGAAATALGVAWLVVQALAVGVLAEMEWMGLRRAPSTAMA
jgi:hypothetical protein